MEEFKWSSKIETGIDVIDEQHQKLFHFATAIYEGQSKLHLNSLLQFLDNYVITHFSTEEKLMRENKFPSYDLHIWLFGLKRKSENGGKIMSLMRIESIFPI
jgi:hemerythrin